MVFANVSPVRHGAQLDWSHEARANTPALISGTILRIATSAIEVMDQERILPMSRSTSEWQRRWRPHQWGELVSHPVVLVLGCVAATVFLRVLMDALLPDSASMLAFVLPISICAAVGGFWPGIAATLSSVIVGNYFFIAPMSSFDISAPEDVARLGVFLLIGMVISTMSGRMHREIDRATEAERKASSQAWLLQEAEERLRITLEAAEAGTWDWDIVRDELVWSNTNYLLYGIDPEKHPIHSYADWLESVSSEDRPAVEQLTQRVLRPAAETNYRAEFRIHHPIKGERWLLRLGRTHRNSLGYATRILGITIDITDRRQKEERERHARSEAERMNRQKDEFVAMVSHELRTPLTSILGWAQLLRRAHGDSDKLDRGLDVIDRNARVLTQLVSDLLDVGRIISGKLNLEPTPLDLAEVTRSAVDLLRPAVRAKGVRLETNIQDLGEPFIGDAARMKQIIWNLVANAIKFTPAEGVVEVSVDKTNSDIRITVKDTGSGIDPSFLPYLFERFQQQDSSSARVHRGLGLGLAIVKHIAELHGGQASARSEGLGRGSVFTVELPRVSNPKTFEPSTLGDVQGPLLPSSSLGGVRVLLVEDEVDTREFVQRVLENSSAKVVSAGSAQEALEVLDDARPDVLVSDIGMPEMDGYTLLRTICTYRGVRREPPLPALALTAFARTEDRQRAFDAGFSEHLAKPVDPAKLVMTIARLSRSQGPKPAACST